MKIILYFFLIANILDVAFSVLNAFQHVSLVGYRILVGFDVLC